MRSEFQSNEIKENNSTSYYFIKVNAIINQMVSNGEILGESSGC